MLHFTLLCILLPLKIRQLKTKIKTTWLRTIASVSLGAEIGNLTGLPASLALLVLTDSCHMHKWTCIPVFMWQGVCTLHACVCCWKKESIINILNKDEPHDASRSSDIYNVERLSNGPLPMSFPEDTVMGEDWENQVPCGAFTHFVLSSLTQRNDALTRLVLEWKPSLNGSVSLSRTECQTWTERHLTQDQWVWTPALSNAVSSSKAPGSSYTDYKSSAQ